MPPVSWAQITSGPTSAKVGEAVIVTSAHTASFSNQTSGALNCKVNYRITHDRGDDKFESIETHPLDLGRALNLSANGELSFSPDVTGPHRMKAETIVECGEGGNDTASSANWSFLVSKD